MITSADMLADVLAIWNGLPEALQKSATLYNRTSGDTYGSGVAYDAYRQPLRMTDASGLNRTAMRWILLGTNGQTELPHRGSKIVVSGVSYHVEAIERAFGDLWHRCDTWEEI